MHFTKLELHNFGVYRGTQELSLSDGIDGRNITLVGGLNGRGKTTLHDAILLALYGKQAMRYIQENVRSYDRLLLDRVNRQASDPETYVAVSLCLDDGTILRVQRAWRPHGQRAEARVLVEKNGAVDPYLGENWSYYIEEILPKNIFFITSQELEDRYPDCTPKEREYKIAKLKGAVFIMQIGGKLKSGLPHDGRAPDYDDWSLNGDIIVYYPVLDIALELSSMGIRVDEDSLKKQLELAGCPERAELPFQKAILNKELPYTIGGGIGQSRICMFYLRKAHIGEVQASLWPEEEIKAAAEHGIELL